MLLNASVCRYELTAASSGPGIARVGMRLPGLIPCALAIHPERLPGLLGKTPAAMVRLLMRWLRSGPSIPPAAVPRIE